MRVAGLVAAVGMVVVPARAAATVCFEPEYLIKRTESSVWRPTTALPAAMPSPKALVHGRSIIVAGRTDHSIAALVWSSTILPDGRLGGWVAGPPIPEDAARWDFGLAAGPDYLYVVGGDGGSHQPESITVLVAQLSPDGAVGPWRKATPLPAPRTSAAVFVEAGQVYVAGGATMGVTQSSVWRAAVQRDGTLGAWTALPALPRPIGGATVVTTDTTVYLMYGHESVADTPSTRKYIPGAARVRLATPRGDPAGTRWDVSDAALPLPGAALAAGSRDRLHAIGGSTGGCGCCTRGSFMEILHQVQTTTLGSRDVTAWTERSMLPSGRSGAAAVFAAGYLFVIGGQAGKVPLSDVLVAAEDQLAYLPPESANPPRSFRTARPAPPAPATAPTGCGCRSSGSAPAGLVVLAALIAARRRRRSAGDRYPA